MLAKTPSQEVMFEAAAKEAARLYATDPRQFINAGNEEAVTRCASHRLFTIVPDRLRMVETVEIKTTYLSSLVVHAIAEVDAAKQVEFFNLTSNHPWFRGSGGYVFEKFVDVWLFSDPQSEGLLCTPAEPTDGSFVLHPVGGENLFVFMGVHVLTGARGHQISGWLPAVSNFPSFDAIIFTPDRIITIQATISSSHNATSTGFEQVETVYSSGSLYRQHRRWCHVFMTHNEETAERLRNQAFPHLDNMDILIYSAVLNSSQLGLTRVRLIDAQTKRVCWCWFYPRWPLPNQSPGRAHPYRDPT